MHTTHGGSVGLVDSRYSPATYDPAYLLNCVCTYISVYVHAKSTMYMHVWSYMQVYSESVKHHDHYT